jgi:CHAD domain-containing protein
MDIARDTAARGGSVTFHEPDRAYRLRGDEPIADGIRRIARGQLLDAQQDLTSPPSGDAGKAIHATRKRLKRLRALVRLARGTIGDPTYAQENVAYRDAGRGLAAGRDAQVMLETLDALTHRAGDTLPERVTAPLRLRLKRECDEAIASQSGAGLAATSSELERAFARTREWSFDGEDFAALTPGLKKIYRRGRKRMRAAQQDPSAEHLHAWRKRVKDLWYTTQIVQAAQPKRLKKIARRAHKLADLLGDGHDLHVLRDYVQAHPQCFEDDAAREQLVAAIDRRADKLCAKALKRGRTLYKRSPRKFARAIERGWRRRYSTLPASAPSALSASVASTARS